ncbi:MAG: 4-alpha-glucanotransferase [Candidatus Caldatribacteriaceae bacterium]
MWKERLKDLATILGVYTSYDNIRGERVEVPSETLVAVSSSLGVEDFSEQGLKEAISRVEEKRRFLDSLAIVTRKRRKRVQAPLDALGGEFVVRSEEGEILQSSPLSSLWAEVTLPEDCPWGYYTLSFHPKKGEERSSLLILSPMRAFLPEGRNWGVHCALSALSTERNQGIGDLKDLEDLQSLLLGCNGRYLGLLPLHLTAKKTPHDISPYLSLSRFLFDPVYLPLEEVIRLFPGASPFHGITPASSDGYVDYEEVWKKKEFVLRKVFSAFLRERERFQTLWEAFEEFLRREGERLYLASLYQVIAEEKGFDWRLWPAPLQKRDPQALEKIKEDKKDDVLYFSFLQWLVHLFLERITKKEHILCFDLPIGCAPWGIESWLSQEKIAFGCSVGAPPDDFAPEGQNWGFHPFSPWKMMEDKFTDFIALIRFNMRFARFLRLDHIMGLKRLFWIPEGEKASKGTYVENPLRKLLAILTLESTKCGVTLIGEDLGTVPRSLRSILPKSGILSTRVFYFERDGVLPRPPQSYPRKCCATINTHDMPPLKAFAEGKDVLLREALRIFTPEEAARFLEDRRAFVAKCYEKLQEWGFLKGEENSLFWAICRFLAATPSCVISVSLDDILESDVQMNLPGTVGEYPNWRKKLPVEWEIMKNRLLSLVSISALHSRGEKRYAGKNIV